MLVSKKPQGTDVSARGGRLDTALRYPGERGETGLSILEDHLPRGLYKQVPFLVHSRSMDSWEEFMTLASW